MNFLKKYSGYIVLAFLVYILYSTVRSDSFFHRIFSLGAFKKNVIAALPADKNNFSFEKAVLDLDAVFDPVFDRKSTEEQIQSLAQRVGEKINGDADPEQIMAKFNESMFNDYGFIFDAKANALLYQGGGGGTFSTEDFLNYQSLGRVLQRRQGICLSLTTLYLIIGDRLKIPVYGVIMPGHIFVRYQDLNHSGINSETTFGGVEYYGYKGSFGTEFMDNPDTVYNKCVDKSTVLAAILNNFSIMYSNQKDYSKAEFLLKKSMELAPYLPESHLGLGAIYADMGRLNEAKAELEKALGLFPGAAGAELLLGAIYLEEKDFGPAEEHLMKALKAKNTAQKAAEELELLKKQRGS